MDNDWIWMSPKYVYVCFTFNFYKSLFLCSKSDYKKLSSNKSYKLLKNYRFDRLFFFIKYKFEFEKKIEK